MSFSDYNELPQNVRDFVFGPEISRHNGEIGDKYLLNRDQLDLIVTLEEGIFFKKLSVLDLPNRLEEMERAKFYDLRAITLDIAYKLLWPLQDFLEDVDRLILRLGGKVPQLQHLQSTQEPAGIPEIFDASVAEAAEKYNGFKELRLTTNKIVDKDGHMVSPIIDNWIKDYVHFLGAGRHTSLERAKYLSQNNNALGLSEEDRATLRNFLISYDEDTKVRITKAGALLRLAEYHKEEKQKIPIKTRDEFLAEISQKLGAMDESLLSADILLSEAGGNVFKLRDILWQALGLADKDKITSCLRVLVQRRAFDMMLKEDNRFINTVKRFVGVRYGYAVERNFGPLADLGLQRRVFLEMIFSDKLRLGNEGPLIAFYLTNLLSGDTQMVYFDENDGQLKWRGLQVINDKLIWLDEIDQNS